MLPSVVKDSAPITAVLVLVDYNSGNQVAS
jgi:hypothetical protein